MRLRDLVEGHLSSKLVWKHRKTGETTLKYKAMAKDLEDQDGESEQQPPAK